MEDDVLLGKCGSLFRRRRHSVLAGRLGLAGASMLQCVVDGRNFPVQTSSTPGNLAWGGRRLPRDRGKPLNVQ